MFFSRILVLMDKPEMAALIAFLAAFFIPSIRLLASYVLIIIDL